jgi:hypothetical protein
MFVFVPIDTNQLNAIVKNREMVFCADGNRIACVDRHRITAIISLRK